MRDYYLNVLGLPTGSSDEAIRKAYRKLAKRYHPDVSTEHDAQKKFVAITQAYEYLTTPRAAYTAPKAKTYASPFKQQPKPQSGPQWKWKKQEKKGGPFYTAQQYAKMSRKEFQQTSYYKNTKRQLINGILSVQGFTIFIIWAMFVWLFVRLGLYVVSGIFFLLPFAFVVWALNSRPGKND